MAYNRYYQYETSPRKVKPEYEYTKTTYPKKSTARKVDKKEKEIQNRKLHIKIISYIAICFTALFIISYRYSMLDDTYAKLTSKRAELAAIDKENRQLEATIESNLNLTKIEEDAKNLLGMQKLSPEQKVYVTLPKTDHVETSSDEIKAASTKDNWLIDIINKIIDSFK